MENQSTDEYQSGCFVMRVVYDLNLVKIFKLKILITNSILASFNAV